jgi:hypothetical protein
MKKCTNLIKTLNKLLYKKKKESHLHLQFEWLINNGRTLPMRASMMWFACIWSIWKARNEKYFNNKEIQDISG